VTGPSLADLDAFGRLGAPLDALRLNRGEASRYGALRAGSRRMPGPRTGWSAIPTWPSSTRALNAPPATACYATGGSSCSSTRIPPSGSVADRGRLAIFARAGRLDRVSSVFASA